MNWLDEVKCDAAGMTPAVVMETDVYTDAQIAAWDAADALGDDERQALERKLAAR